MSNVNSDDFFTMRLPIVSKGDVPDNKVCVVPLYAPWEHVPCLVAVEMMRRNSLDGGAKKMHRIGFAAYG